MQTKKKLALLLICALLLTMLRPSYSAEAAASKKQNPITELGIAELPKDNTIQVGSYFNFNPDIISTRLGKGKTTGIIYWEVNTQTNTAGVTSSRWGYVYPVYAGSFEIRAVAFANSEDMNAWKSARSANGKVEDAKAGQKYVTAYSDWVTIQVTAKEEGYAVARTQYQLNLALKNRNVSDIHIITDKERTFTIKSANYTGKTLTVKAPNSDVVNAGRFAQINVEQIKSSTFYEKGWGNRFHISAPNASFHVEKGARVQNLEFAPAAAKSKINIVGNGGRINNIDISAAGEVKISGSTSAEIPVTVKETAAGTTIDTQIKLVINVNASMELSAAKEATETVLNLLKAVEACIRGEAEKITVNVDEAAGGAVIKSETALEVDAGASVSVELSEGAEGTTVSADEDVSVTVKNETKEEVVITDEEGNETVAKPGEEETTVTTPAPTGTPEVTGTPSTPGSTGTPSTPSTPSTPTPTPGEEEPTPTPGEDEPTPTPGEEEPTPTPGEDEPTPTPDEEEPTPTPDEDEPTPTPGEDEPTPTPGEDEPTPTPDEDEPTPTPGEDEAATVTVSWSGAVTGSHEFSTGSEAEKIVILPAGTTGTLTFTLDENSAYTLTESSLSLSGTVSTFAVGVQSSETEEAVRLGQIYFIAASTPQITSSALSAVSGSAIEGSSINVNNGTAVLTVVTGASVSCTLTESAYTTDVISQLTSAGINVAYQWYADNSAIAGETEKSYTALVNSGDTAVTKAYHVVVTLSKGTEVSELPSVKK